MICPKCGSKNPNDSVFCVSCGEKIIEEKKYNKKIFVALIIVSVICVLSITSTVILSVLFVEKQEEYNEIKMERDSLKQTYNSIMEENRKSKGDDFTPDGWTHSLKWYQENAGNYKDKDLGGLSDDETIDRDEYFGI